jgi:glycosyltransferase involved in cell wall biosynthesis
MKILFIDFVLPYLLKDAPYPVGGWSVQLHAWLKGLAASGNRPGILTWKGANAFVNKRVDFDLVETYDPALGLKKLRLFYYRLPELYKRAREFKPDVMIQACAGMDTGIMYGIAKTMGVPFIYRVANDADADSRHKAHLRFYEQLSFAYGLKNSHMILCQNQYQLTKMKFRFPEKPVHLISNPYSGNILSPSLVPRLNSRAYIAWLGLFRKEKNLPLLYCIAHKLPRLKFKIAGSPVGNRLDNETKRALQKLSMCKNVEFVGYISRAHVPSFLSKAKVLLNTSLYEGFSNTFLEAFAVGTPVAALSRVDPNAVIETNQLGPVSQNPCRLSSLIQKFVSDKEGYCETSIRCRDYVANNHDPRHLALRLVDLIRQTLA